MDGWNECLCFLVTKVLDNVQLKKKKFAHLNGLLHLLALTFQTCLISIHICTTFFHSAEA